jgi:small subunit ribosomal protein S5
MTQENNSENIDERDQTNQASTDSWIPKTKLGKKIKNKEITNIAKILDSGDIIFETEIVDRLLPDLEKDLLLVGQAKGKFGGGKRRVFRQVQKKTSEGNKPRFATCAVVGNKNGLIGIGYGKSKETVPARDKAFRNAKLNIFKLRRGCGSWECMCGEPHSIPFSVEGKAGSVIIKLIPAPKGTGLCVEKECAKILELGGIKDIWAKTYGQTRTKINLISACEKALRKLIETKIRPHHKEILSIKEGEIKKQEKQEEVMEKEDSKEKKNEKGKKEK